MKKYNKMEERNLNISVLEYNIYLKIQLHQRNS